MSVLIKDMEMPKKCGECAIYVRYRTWNDDPGDEFCGMTKENVSYKTKPDWCPLSEVPERKKGKWIERNPQNSDKCRLIECDQCGFAHIVGFNVPYEHWIENRNFCERCGSDMRGNHND